MEQGNGDPNARAVRRGDHAQRARASRASSCCFDNFYVDAEVSYDGHAWSTGAYATDVVEKIWPTNYGGRGGIYLSEGGWEDRDAVRQHRGARRTGTSGISRSARASACAATASSPCATAPSGLMTAQRPRPRGPRPPAVSAVRPRRSRTTSASTSGSRSSASSRPTGNLPRLSIIRLGNDHTVRHACPARRRRARWSPTTISPSGASSRRSRKSRYWKESAIFVLEDDAQNGPDHVDAHRSVALVISPFAKRQARGQHALHDVGHAADDGADPRAAADEPVRRGGHADVQRVPGRRRT